MSEETATETNTTAKVVKVRNFIDSAKAREDITYSLVDLSSAMQEQASLHLHYAEQLAAATRQVNDLKVTLEAAESTVYRKLRDGYVDKGVKFTEALLEKETAAHPSIRKIKMAINEAKQIADVAKGVVESFSQRKDMLIQHGAKDRVEFQGELRMKEIQERDGAVKSLGQNVLERRASLKETAA